VWRVAAGYHICAREITVMLHAFLVRHFMIEPASSPVQNRNRHNTLWQPQTAAGGHHCCNYGNQ
jgi:hypothetical protein